jgi:hypothetical protein
MLEDSAERCRLDIIARNLLMLYTSSGRGAYLRREQRRYNLLEKEESLMWRFRVKIHATIRAHQTYVGQTGTIIPLMLGAYCIIAPLEASGASLLSNTEIANAYRQMVLSQSLALCNLMKLTYMGCDAAKRQQIVNDVTAKRITVIDKNKQSDGSYIAIITSKSKDGGSVTSRFGFLPGADGLVVTCYDSPDGRHACR